MLECPLYENQREKLRKLFETCGIVHLDLNLLLDVKADDDYKEWRTLILSELELLLLLICLHYLAAYGRQVHSDLFGKLHDVQTFRDFCG